MNPAGDSCDSCEVDGWNKDDDDDECNLDGYTPTNDSLSYRVNSAASRVAHKVQSMGLMIERKTALVNAGMKWAAMSVEWIVAEVVRLGSLVGHPVYMIVITVGKCVFQITLSALERLCDGACWAGLAIGKLIRQHGTQVVIKCCRLSGCLVFMTIEFGGHIVVRIAQLGCHTLLNM